MHLICMPDDYDEHEKYTLLLFNRWTADRFGQVGIDDLDKALEVIKENGCEPELCICKEWPMFLDWYTEPGSSDPRAVPMRVRKHPDGFEVWEYA